MIVGIDFDNTIVCYDDLFHKVALEKGLIENHVNKNKFSVRQYLIDKNRESEWTSLQGIVYGSRMEEAIAYSGALDGIISFQKRGISTYIVSHKTQYPIIGPKVDMQASARLWIENNLSVSGKQVFGKNKIFFNEKKDEKLEQIVILNCGVFIDDLPEILLSRKLPKKVYKILFDPANKHPVNPNYTKVQSWNELKNIDVFK